MGRLTYYGKLVGHGIRVFVSTLARVLTRLIKNFWQAHKENSARREMERQHLMRIEREGQAFGHGEETGRIRARNEAYQRREAQRDDTRAFRDFSRGVDNDSFIPYPKKKRKRYY